MLLKGTKGYFKDKFLKSEQGKTLRYEYERLKSGRSWRGQDAIYVKEGNKLLELKPTYEYLTKRQLVEKFGGKEAAVLTDNRARYQFPTRFDAETTEKLKSYLLQILSNGTIKVYYDPDKTKDTRIFPENFGHYYNYGNMGGEFKVINLSKYFEYHNITVKEIIGNPNYVGVKQLDVLAGIMANGRLPFNMKSFVTSEIAKSTDDKYGRIVGVRYDSKSEAMLDEILSEIVSYKVLDGKYEKKDSGYDERLVKLIKVKEGKEITLSDIAKCMDKDPQLEKALVTHYANPAPKWYRKDLRASFRAKADTMIKKMINGDVDLDSVGLDRQPKNASRYW